ncbi:hypothetical protein MKW98_015966, partial [Papaver atlanticum]
MEGNGKSPMRIISVMLIVGMFMGQISADSVSDYLACFKPCYYNCMNPNPEDKKLSDTCLNICGLACIKKSPLDNSHRKIL